MTLTFLPFFLLDFLRISLEYFARHFRRPNLFSLRYWFLFYTLHFEHLWCGNTIAVSGFLFGNWDTLAMQLITQAYPSPFPSLSMCAPRSAVSIFIVKVKMQTDAALQFGYVSFASSTSSLSSSYSASLLVCLVRFVGFIINEGSLFAVLRCFVFAASSGFIFLQCLLLFFSPSLFFFCPAFMQFLRISCALLNILTGVSASPAWHLQYLLSTVAQWISFQATGQSRAAQVKKEAQLCLCSFS